MLLHRVPTRPVPGQTIEDIVRAEAVFLERVIELHPEAEGKPAVIGNCQAGWAVMLVAAVRPELFGPIITCRLAAIVLGRRARREPDALHWRTVGWQLAYCAHGDLGNGKFDGAWLVTNFENLNPANTLVVKAVQSLFQDRQRGTALSRIRTVVGRSRSAQRRGNAVHRRRAVCRQQARRRRDRRDRDGTRFDLRNITSPIIVFCSKADNITPPPQALDWILDLYDSVDEIRAHGQTIVYAVHELIGHLGIFVSGSVAKKEHDEFASNIDLIDVLPPGLYEAVMTPEGPE